MHLFALKLIFITLLDIKNAISCATKVSERNELVQIRLHVVYLPYPWSVIKTRVGAEGRDSARDFRRKAR